MRTEIHLPARIEKEVRSSEKTGLGIWSLSAVDTHLEALLISKALVPFAELDVGNIRIDLFIFAHHQRLIRMIVAIGGQLPALKIGFIFSDGGDVFFPPSNIGLRFS